VAHFEVITDTCDQTKLSNKTRTVCNFPKLSRTRTIYVPITTGISVRAVPENIFELLEAPGLSCTVVHFMHLAGADLSSSICNSVLCLLSNSQYLNVDGHEFALCPNFKQIKHTPLLLTNFCLAATGFCLNAKQR